jgi:hypothetical protein
MLPAAKRRAGMLRSFVTRLLVFMPMLLTSFLIIFFSGKDIDQPAALAVYGAEIQTFAIFAALAPIFLTFAQLKARGRTILKELAAVVVSIILTSVTGIAICIWLMMNQKFDGISVFLPVELIVGIATMMSLYFLGYAGFKRILGALEEM